MRFGLDIDSTLAETSGALLKALNRQYGTKYKLGDWTDWDLSHCLNVPGKAELNEFMDRLFNDGLFMFTCRPLPYAVDGVSLLAGLGDVYYITSRHQDLADSTMSWLDRHNFPCGEIYMGVNDKASLAKELELNLCVEDAPHHALKLARAGVGVFLLDWPWNQGVKHDLITRVQGWARIIALLEGET